MFVQHSVSGFVMDPFNPGRHFPCTVCHKRYKNKETLKAHVRLDCGKELRFKCPRCPYKSKRKYCLMQHVQVHQIKYLDTELQDAE